jgi:PAS domain S-box-containing protein
MPSAREPDQPPGDEAGYAFRLARMGRWTLHRDPERLDLSPELEEVMGLARGSFAGKLADFRHLVSPLDLPRVQQAAEDSLQTGEQYSVTFRFLHAGTDWRWMEARGLPRRGPDGTTVRVDGICVDVTERIAAENANFLFAAIVANSDDAIVSKTLDGIITSWNAGATRLFGYAVDEMVGAPIARIIPPDLLSEEQEILSKLRLGERIDHYETRRCARDGSTLEVSITVSPVRDITGAIVGASNITREVGALRRALADRDQLLVSERNARAEAERLGYLKDEFLATLSHELRTPLTTIIGWANLLRRRPGMGAEELKAAVETIHRNAQAQAQIIDDLLDMSRIISGKISLQTDAVDLRELVRTAVDGIRPPATVKNLGIFELLDPAAGLVTGDAARLQQVLWNLLTNAVKFTPAGGYIRVRLEWLHSHARISVEDSGIGIEPEFLPHVFERFRQADGSTQREHGGLGLGLSIVRNLVELHGGSVAVESAGRGRGTTFSVNLPLARPEGFLFRPGEKERRALQATDLLLPSLVGTRVLIVDDEPDGRALLARLLQEAGAQVIAAEGALQALEILQRERVQAILSDIGMPGIDGYEFMRRVRSTDDHAVSAIPAIALTAYARKEDRMRSLAAGFQQHIAKPYSFGELAQAVAALQADPRRN